MNKFIITLAALATLSTASLAAGNRSNELRDTQYYTSSGVPAASTASELQSEGFAIVSVRGETAFERATRLSYENDHGRH